MPSKVFEKLNLKDHRAIVVLGAPSSFEAELRTLAGVDVSRALKPAKRVGFALLFATRQTEVDAFARALGQAAAGDAVVWIAYPKGTSKRYTCDFNRDTGWRALGRLGFEPVRHIAIDDDWSALRFRRAQFIRSMTRAAGRAISAAGRTKAIQGAKKGRPTTR